MTVHRAEGAPASRVDAGDAGLSLIELVVYIVVLGILAGGIALIFSNTWRAQASVTGQTEATGRGQLIASQIEKAMRNAVAFDVRDSSGASSSTGTGPTLMVATDLPGSKACQVFSFTGSTAQMSLRSGALGTGPWTTWQSGVTQHSGTAFFAENATSVAYAFDFTTSDAPTVTLSGTAYMRNPTGGSQTCF